MLNTADPDKTTPNPPRFVGFARQSDGSLLLFPTGTGRGVKSPVEMSFGSKQQQNNKKFKTTKVFGPHSPGVARPGSVPSYVNGFGGTLAVTSPVPYLGISRITSTREPTGHPTLGSRGTNAGAPTNGPTDGTSADAAGDGTSAHAAGDGIRRRCWWPRWHIRRRGP